MTLGARAVRAALTGRRFVFTVNVDWFFESHRLPLALALLEAGADVHLLSATTDSAPRLRRAGLHVTDVGFTRRGRHPGELVSLFRIVRRHLSRIEPDLVHNVTVKPILVGSVAAATIDRSIPVVNAISGFGHLLSDPEAGRLAPVIARAAYRAALRAPRCTAVVMQNRAAADMVAGAGLARRADVRLIPGMGVDTDEFKPATGSDEGPPTVMLLSRMIATKGIREFVAASARVRVHHPNARFVLVGGVDAGNPLSLTATELHDLEASSGVEWWGPTTDVSATLRRATVFVLPTYHEGLPKTLLEAAATGLPIVTSDIPGCREVLTDGLDGILCPPRTVAPLAAGISALLAAPDAARAMGERARERVLDGFTTAHAVDAHMAVYEELLDSQP